MTVVSARPIFSATQRNLIWGFIALLAALAFLRSLAPENTANAVRKLIKPREASSKTEKEELEKLRDEIHRERIALERLQNETGDSRDFLEKFEEFHEAEDERGVVAADQIVIPPLKEDSDAVSDQSSSVEEQSQWQDHDDASNLAKSEVSDEVAEIDDITDVGEGEEEEYALQLADGECPTIIALESSKSGLGTQVEHLLSLLSLSFAVQNACVVLPPINSYDDENNFRPVAFGEVFDEEEFSGTGVRTVPLSVCNEIGVSHVFDDGGAETAIVKNFAAFVRESDPDLAKETTLVHTETRGHRFENSSVINGDVTIMATYISEMVGRQNERMCIAFGRMRTEVAINVDTLEHLKPAASVAEFVAGKYPLANETMFIKLRWNKLICEHTRTEEGTVCIVSDVILPTKEYIKSIAYTARQMDVSFIYLSLPSHAPDDVSEDVYTNLKILEPILLSVDGDIFTANLIEHELAIQSKVFIPDGGAWSDTVQMLRSRRNPTNFRDDIDSSGMVQAWKDAGWPKDSPFLISGEHVETHADTSENMRNHEQDSNVMHNGQESPAHYHQIDRITQQQEANANMQPPSGDNAQLFLNQQNNSDGAVHSPDTEHRPAKYEPPENYVPNEETDGHLFPNPGTDVAQASQESQAEQLSTAEQQPLVETSLPAQEAAPPEKAAPAEENASMDDAAWTEERASLEAAAEHQIPPERSPLPHHQLPSEQESHADEQLTAEQRRDGEYQTQTEQQLLLQKVALAEEQHTRSETVSLGEQQLPDQEATLAQQQIAAEQYHHARR